MRKVLFKGYIELIPTVLYVDSDNDVFINRFRESRYYCSICYLRNRYLNECILTVDDFSRKVEDGDEYAYLSCFTSDGVTMSSFINSMIKRSYDNIKQR